MIFSIVHGCVKNVCAPLISNWFHACEHLSPNSFSPKIFAMKSQPLVFPGLTEGSSVGTWGLRCVYWCTRSRITCLLHTVILYLIPPKMSAPVFYFYTVGTILIRCPIKPCYLQTCRKLFDVLENGWFCNTFIIACLLWVNDKFNLKVLL